MRDRRRFGRGDAPGLVRAVEDEIGKGGGVAECVAAASLAGAPKLLQAAVEALAERQAAERDAGRN